MATVLIQKRKRQNRNSYVIYYKDPYSGKKKYYKTHQKQKDAQQTANELRYLIDNGKLPEAVKSRIKAHLLSFHDVAEQLIIDWECKLQQGELSPITVKEYVRRTLQISLEIGMQLLCEFTKKDISNYRDNISRTTSNVNANRSLFVIKQVFKKGLELNSISENPISSIKQLSEKKHQRNKFLLPDGVITLIEASKLTIAKYYMPALIYLGAEHGASKQEVLSLRWSDIDFNFDGVGIIRFFRTKNNKERTEYFMPRSREAIIAWKKHLAWMRHRKKIKSNGSDFVFCHLDGSPIKSFKKAWKSICEKAGIENFHYHDLRHTFCSNLLLSGAGLKDVKDMIGHGDISMTDRYSHLTTRHKFLRQQQLAEHYESNDKMALGNT